MILSDFQRSITIAILLISGLTLGVTTSVFASTEISEEKLNTTEKSLRWGGEGLPFDSVITIRDSLVNSIVGKVVIDRHGEDNGTQESTGFLSGVFNALIVRSPFAGPNPGRMTIVTLWGSKEEGCFVKTILHNAPKNSENSSQDFVPIKMEVGVGNRVVKLTPVAKSVPKIAKGNYTYTANQVNKTASFYFAENTFAINGKVADLLRNAPKGESRVRITFFNGDTKIFPVGEKNVARWRDVYAYNPNCTEPN
jgi:hypothetical protein